MKKIERYRIAWNTKSDEGIFIIDTPDGLEQILVDNAAEARILLYKLRREGNAYIDRGLILTSDEPLDIPPPVVEPEEPEGEVEFIPHQVSWVIEKKTKPVSIVVTTPKPVAPKEKVVPKTKAKVAPKAKAKPKAKTAPKAKKKTTISTKDKLRLIEGIGPKIEGLLHEAGILSFKDLAKAKQTTLKGILDNAGSRYRMHDPGTWGAQAKLAATGKMEALKKWQDELKGGKKK